MQKLSLGSWPLLASLILSSALCSNVGYADDYYRWIGKDGVVHYGSRPPEGVEAEKISTYGKSAAGSVKADAPATSEQADKQLSKDQKTVMAERKKQCEEERQRLTTLKTPGRRIRMEQPDGSSRYLSAEEVAQEITNSEDFIKQGCK